MGGGAHAHVPCLWRMEYCYHKTEEWLDTDGHLLHLFAAEGGLETLFSPTLSTATLAWSVNFLLIIYCNI